MEKKKKNREVICSYVAITSNRESLNEFIGLCAKHIKYKNISDPYEFKTEILTCYAVKICIQVATNGHVHLLNSLAQKGGDIIKIISSPENKEVDLCTPEIDS